jgi:hypothetical protein
MKKAREDELDKEAEEALGQIMEGLRRYFDALLKMAAARNAPKEQE